MDRWAAPARESGLTGVSGKSDRLGQAFDDGHQLVSTQALAPGETEEFFGAENDRAPRRCGTRHRDSSSPTELHEPFIAQITQGSQDRICVDSQHGRQVAGRWETLTWLGLTLGQGPTDL
jgi:hypothetical protein